MAGKEAGSDCAEVIVALSSTLFANDMVVLKANAKTNIVANFFMSCL